MLLAALAALVGCEEPMMTGGYTRDLAPTMDRLIAAYDDLASKRFLVLADFENPVQGTLFRLEPPGGTSPVTVSTDRARMNTGVGALKMPLVDSSHRVVCSDAPNSEWSLPRDWSKHHLLIFSVFSPRKLGGFTFHIRSGTDLRLEYDDPRRLLEAGWNLVRVDLGDLADRIDLTDVRELAFSCDPLDTPVDLYLDDLILVDNAREIFTSAEREPGDLYVRSQGRRLVVGAIDRFELVFARGLIRQWFDVGQDPACAYNLAGTGSLGPIPIVIPDQPNQPVRLDDASQWAPLGITVHTHQTMIEAMPLRVVIQGQWTFTPPDDLPADTSPYHRWVYTIYRDGRVFVECSGTARTADFKPSRLGMVFCCDGVLGFEPKIVEGDVSASSRPRVGQESYLLFSRPERGKADLLIVPFSPLRARLLENPQDPRLCVCWHLPIENDLFAFSALTRVWPADIDSVEQAGPLAADYCHPLPIAIDAGQLVRTDPGDFDNDGFSESAGHYVIQLDGSIARIRVDGQRFLRFSPVFKVVDVTDRDVWAYLDGRLIRETYRDNDGNCLLELPDVIAREVLLEINARPREAKPE